LTIADRKRENDITLTQHLICTETGLICTYRFLHACRKPQYVQNAIIHKTCIQFRA